MSFTRQIPSLQTMSLRTVGHNDCIPEKIFDNDNEGKNKNETQRLLEKMRDLEADKEFKFKKNANDVDINVPWIACTKLLEDDGYNRHILVIENGNRAVNCLQSYIDALVDLGRFQDGKLGVGFFKEWKKAVAIESASLSSSFSSKKRKRDDEVKDSEKQIGKLGSLSLHNCASIGLKTFGAMKEADVGSVLGTLDLTGVHSLTDQIFTDLIIKNCPNIKRLSVKNCRKLTGKGFIAINKVRYRISICLYIYIYIYIWLIK